MRRSFAARDSCLRNSLPRRVQPQLSQFYYFYLGKPTRLRTVIRTAKKSRYVECRATGGGLDAGDLGSQIGDLEPSVSTEITSGLSPLGDTSATCCLTRLSMMPKPLRVALAVRFSIVRAR